MRLLLDGLSEHCPAPRDELEHPASQNDAIAFSDDPHGACAFFLANGKNVTHVQIAKLPGCHPFGIGICRIQVDDFDPVGENDDRKKREQEIDDRSCVSSA